MTQPEKQGQPDQKQKPLHIPLSFEQAIDGLLAVTPTPSVKPASRAGSGKNATKKAKKPGSK